jgi:hypothetical protein
VQYIEESKPMRDTDLIRVRGVTGVAWAVPVHKAIINDRLPDGTTKAINLTGLDDATLIGGPPRMLEGKLGDLRRADAIIVDREAAEDHLRWRGPDGRERPLAVGDEIEVNDRRALVVGIGESSHGLRPAAAPAIDLCPGQGARRREPAALARLIEAKTDLRALTGGVPVGDAALLAGEYRQTDQLRDLRHARLPGRRRLQLRARQPRALRGAKGDGRRRRRLKRPCAATASCGSR